MFPTKTINRKTNHGTVEFKALLLVPRLALMEMFSGNSCCLRRHRRFAQIHQQHSTHRMSFSHLGSQHLLHSAFRRLPPLPRPPFTTHLAFQDSPIVCQCNLKSTTCHNSTLLSSLSYLTTKISRTTDIHQITTAGDDHKVLAKEADITFLLFR